MKKLPPMAADSCAISPTAVEVTKAIPATTSSRRSGKSSVGALVAPLTCVSRPASQASTIPILASASESFMNRRTSAKGIRSRPSSSPPDAACPE